MGKEFFNKLKRHYKVAFYVQHHVILQVCFVFFGVSDAFPNVQKLWEEELFKDLILQLHEFSHQVICPFYLIYFWQLLVSIQWRELMDAGPEFKGSALP